MAQGNCIGTRNFRFFVAFLAATATLQALGVLHGACSLSAAVCVLRCAT
jgi:hypothetical protein